MLKDAIRKRITDAMKSKRDVEKEVLRVALGEIQAAENRAGKDLPDEEAHKIIRKLIKSNSETLAVADRPEMKTKLETENQVLESLLPQRWDLAAIVAALGSIENELKAAKSDGQATGLAMKLLKTHDAPVDGKDVAEAVKQVRSR
jgi:uncharacterized protein